MVSGHAPARAKKLRYYEDANFRGRVLAPPALVSGTYADRPADRSDDWTGRVALSGATVQVPQSGRFEDDGGLRHQPELDAPEPATPALETGEFARFDDADELDTEQTDQRFRPDRRLQTAARLAALDPDDGIAL